MIEKACHRCGADARTEVRWPWAKVRRTYLCMDHWLEWETVTNLIAFLWMPASARRTTGGV